MRSRMPLKRRDESPAAADLRSVLEKMREKWYKTIFGIRLMGKHSLKEGSENGKLL